jgi:CRISPR/Cas system-associated endonuclease Cas1
MHDGKGCLVQDLIEPLKAEMIDSIVFQVARESLSLSDFELTPTRCMLSDELVKKMICLFHTSINNEKIDNLVYNLFNAITNNREFIVRY